jgi:hypothetical protein
MDFINRNANGNHAGRPSGVRRERYYWYIHCMKTGSPSIEYLKRQQQRQAVRDESRFHECRIQSDSTGFVRVANVWRSILSILQYLQYGKYGGPRPWYIVSLANELFPFLCCDLNEIYRWCSSWRQCTDFYYCKCWFALIGFRQNKRECNYDEMDDTVIGANKSIPILSTINTKTKQAKVVFIHKYIRDLGRMSSNF